MTTKIILSIVIPTYNRVESLKKTVLSILNQLKTIDASIELIISDNYSTDGTKEYLSQLKHDALKVNFNETNIGIFPNIQKGLDYASGEYVWVVGSDDIVVDGMIKLLQEHITLNEPDLVFFNNYFYFPSEQQVNDNGFVEKNTYDRRITSNRETGLYRTKELIDLRIDAFTSIYSFILKREDWLNALKLHSNKLELFDSAENCIPHAIYIARNLANKICLYIAEPIVLASHEVGWKRFFPLYFMQYLPDLYSEWQTHGVNKSQIKKCKQALFDETGHSSCIKLLLNDSQINRRFNKFLYMKRFYNIKGSFQVFKKMVFQS